MLCCVGSSAAVVVGVVVVVVVAVAVVVMLCYSRSSSSVYRSLACSNLALPNIKGQMHTLRQGYATVTAAAAIG